MRKLIVLLAFSASLVATAAAGTVRAPTEKEAQKSVERLSEAFKAAQNKDCGKAIKLARPLADAPQAAGLNDVGASAALEIVARCDYMSGRVEAAAAAIRRATALDGAPDELWHLRLAFDLDAKNSPRAVETIEAMTQGRGQALNTVDQTWFWQFSRSLKDGGDKDLRLRLLKVLSNATYAPTEPLASADGFRLAYAELLADAGKSQEARALILDLKSPRDLARASLDPRFRGFFTTDPDLRAAWEARADEGRRAISLHPDLLDPLIETAAALRVLGKPQQALALLQTAVPSIGTKGAFRDADAKLNWFYDGLARSYAALGRYDEAVASFRTGAAIQEYGTPNVSQTINLAYAQFSFGHGEDALKTLAAFDDPKRKGSPYGESEMRLARGCARAVDGRPTEAAGELAYLREHEKDHPEALSDLLLCLGDMDGAATAMIRRLEDSERRADALLQLSDYDPQPANGPHNPIGIRLDDLKRRPDVKTAIERAGGIRRFNIQSDEL